MAPIQDFTTEIAKGIVKNALRKVADFRDNADFEQFTFQHFHDYHKEVFLTHLKLGTNAIKDANSYYDIVLNANLINQWNTLKDCVDYLFEENILRVSNTTPVQF